MYDWKGKNPTLLLVQLSSRLQVRRSVYWFNFLCSSLDIFPFWWDCISWKQREKAKQGGELGKFPSRALRDGVQERGTSEITGYLFCPINFLSGIKRKKLCDLLSLNTISCSSVPRPFICLLHLLQEPIPHVSQPCTPAVPPSVPSRPLRTRVSWRGVCHSWQLSPCPLVFVAQPEPGKPAGLTCRCKTGESPMSAWTLPCPQI